MKQHPKEAAKGLQPLPRLPERPRK